MKSCWTRKEKAMRIEDVLALLVAMCRILEISPEELAEVFKEGRLNQEYYDVLISLVRR